jgi:hypothetical protein
MERLLVIAPGLASHPEPLLRDRNHNGFRETHSGVAQLC